MKNEDVLRTAFLNNTIRLIGECGFEKATTKAITYDGLDLPGIKLNEVYIYRLFGSKVKLYDAAFSVLDYELFDCVNKFFGDLPSRSSISIDDLQLAFGELWRFLLGNEKKCRCYVRYFYSSYFESESLRKHRRLLQEQSDFFAPLFKEESDVASIIHTTFMTMLDFAIRVYNRDLEDNDINAYHVFLVACNAIKTYVRPEVVQI